MTQYSKLNVIYHLQKWLDSVPGQTFMNYAYSWGASIVILGTLFKLTHLPGANLMLFIGMGTEVFVFFIAAFDRPFDKTADGMELPTHVDAQAPLSSPEGETIVSSAEGQTVIGGGGIVGGVVGGGVVGGGVVGEGITGGGGIVGGGGTVIIGGGGVSANGNTTGENVSIEAPSGIAGGTMGVIGGVVGGVVEQPELPDIDAEEMEEATASYVEQLKKLTETLQKVSEQSERLTRDSEEMENLNRTLTGICKVYEMQLKGASQQIGTIDQINEQSRHMAEQIAELNKIYTRMIEAMTVNMPKGPLV